MTPPNMPNANRSELKDALRSLMPFYRKAAFFSLFTSLLALAPTGYMMEVYDRVVNSANSTTLAMLTILIVAAYVLMELLEWVRTEIMHSAGVALDAKLGNRVFDAMFEANLRRLPVGGGQALSDLRTVRDFLSTPAVLAIMDLPIAFFCLVVIYMIDPRLGGFSLLGAVVQVILAVINEKTTQPPLTEANKAAMMAQGYASGTLRNAQVIESMGMIGRIQQRWMDKQRKFLYLQAVASDRAGASMAMSKCVQMAQGSLVLGLGCWLTLNGHLPPSGSFMIVASVLAGRVLTPLVQVVGVWRLVASARDSYVRLDQFLRTVPERQAGMPMPPPIGQLSVEGVVAAAPGSPVPILRGVSFQLPAGEILAIVGPSASGKTTLARLLMGIWPASNGKVRLDGVDIYPWNKAELGPHLGYLPQGIELFDGTLAENIARFGEVDMEKVEAAARAVGLHDIIMALPDGYESRIGEEGSFLSGGQRQRVGLARAIYGNPRFVVLDEPNSSLDEAGEVALANTLRLLKSQGTTLVVITHRTNILAVADRMLILRDGQVQAYGPRDEVLAALAKAQQQAAVPAVAAQPATA